jgi:transposase
LFFAGAEVTWLKLLWFDGDGLCLFAKRLEKGRFIWPQASEGAASLTRAQLSMLLGGIDWRWSEENLDARACGMSGKRDSPVFMRVL